MNLKQEETIMWHDHIPPAYVPLLVKVLGLGVRIGYHSRSMSREPYSGHVLWIIDGLPYDETHVVAWSRMPKGPTP